jgi:hypothetical protein
VDQEEAVVTLQRQAVLAVLVILHLQVPPKETTEQQVQITGMAVVVAVLVL